MQVGRRVCDLLVLFLTFGGSSHCIFEELFDLLANSAFTVEIFHSVDTSTHHHHHHDTSDSHKHGESHSILAVDVGNKILHSVGLVSPLFLLAFFLTSIIYTSSLLGSRLQLLSTLDKQHSYLCQFIWSLSIAPQAPPCYVL